MAKYSIISWEEESLIDTDDLEVAREKFLSYVRSTQEEYITNNMKTVEEVDEHMKDIKKVIYSNIDNFNDYLKDYGFNKLIVNH